jgi:hypothetical protein
MQLPNTLLGWIFLGLAAVATGSFAYGLRALIVYASINIHGVLWDQLKAAAATKVAALEQDPSLAGLASDDKKERAMVHIIDLAERMGLDVTVSEASDLIEEAVYLLQKVALPAVADALG